jgi:4-amino-4-deoxy-L-arabinose transferase-like glycosyltransferase
VALLIAVTLVIRVGFAGALGLGIDETYMVASGRDLHLSYFDHPPLSWWMAWAGAHVFGTDAAWAVRLPFVLTFAGTTWLMFTLTRWLFDSRAGLWAAVTLNLAPVLGVTSATWVLPDGPLLAALLGAACCLVAAVTATGRAAWWWWLGAGACAGSAMLSKYSAVLTIAGAALFLLTDRDARAWLRRPHPYAAALVAAVLFSPVVVWNAQHGWASIAFQSGRAGATELAAFGPFWALAGEAAFLLPWIWLLLVVLFLRALWRGPARRESWLPACLALPSLVVFTVVALWTRVLFHWAAPGYLMLFPLLGDWIARSVGRPALRIGLIGSAVLVVLGMLLVGVQVSLGVVSPATEVALVGGAPDIDAVDWSAVPQALAERGLLGRPRLVVAAIRWLDAGKLDYALGGRMAVICLTPDAREYGVTTHMGDYVGDDVLIVAPRLTHAQVVQWLGPLFDGIEEMPPITVEHAGQRAMVLSVFLARNLHA